VVSCAQGLGFLHLACLSTLLYKYAPLSMWCLYSLSSRAFRFNLCRFKWEANCKSIKCLVIRDVRTSWSIWEDEEKFQALTQTPRATNIPVFLVVQTSEVPRISSEVPRFSTGTQPPGKSSEVPSFWKFRPIKSPESRWLSRITHTWGCACIRSWWSLEEMVVELTGKIGLTGLPNRSDRFWPSAVWLCIELQD
jgi:hypothetical protein